MCGDASITALKREQSVQEFENNEEKRKLFDNNEDLLLRGRSDYSKLGYLRTKPGFSLFL